MDKASIRALQKRQLHPELYMKETEINRRNCQRVVPLEVLSLGMPHTGTLTMKSALQILGYDDTYHMTNTWTNVLDIDMWNEAYKALKPTGSSSSSTNRKKTFGRAEWDMLLGHCMVVTDVPAVAFSTDLIAAYPDAKVILVSRDLDAWYTSISKFIDASFRRGSAILAWMDPWYTGRMHSLARRNAHALFSGARTASEAKANAKKAFEEHYETVRRVTPKERLLEFDLKSGWGPLCEFLGKEVPDVRFPNMRQSVVFGDLGEAVFTRSMERALVNAGIAFVASLITVWVLWTLKSYLFVDGVPISHGEL